MGSLPNRTEAGRLRRLATSALGAAAASLLLASGASAQTIVNTSSTGGQTNWLETFATGGESGNNANTGRISVLVRHAANRRVTGLKIDDDYNGSDNTTSESTRAVSIERPNVSGGYHYSRATYQYQMPTNTGMSCPVFGTRTRRTERPLRIRAVLDDGTLTQSTSSTIKFVATGQCSGSEDYPFIYERSQTATSINTDQNVTFTYKGDDKDSDPFGGGDDFEGIRWRARRLSDGQTTTPQMSCPDNGDNANKNLTVNFPDRGRWIIEAELRNDGGCTGNANPGYWHYIGEVDVNSPASVSPAINLTATRPQKNGNTTITAAVDDADDASADGVAEAIEWDLDENTSNGVNGYEDTSLGDHATGLTSAQRTRTLNTTGMSPGLHTIRARVGDNGALGGADNIRRTATDTVQFLVNSDPVVANQSVATETEEPLAIDLDGSDVDGDSLSYMITDPPNDGVLSGSGANRTYTPNAGFAGTDFFSVFVSDGFGGSDTATVSIRIDPNTTIDAAPTGTQDDRGAQIEFSSLATGATFECSLDGAPFTGCTSPISYTDLGDGEHEFEARAIAAGNTDPTPASTTWTVDAFPDVTIDSGPDAETADIFATFTFSTSQAGATVAPTTECKLDGGEFRPCSSPITYNDLDDGGHSFTVRATDAFGKSETAERLWTVDAIGSNTLIDSGPPARTGSTDAAIAFSSPDPDATFECSVDRGPWEECTSPVDLTGLTEGNHNFRARAIDVADIADPTPAQTSWRVDLTPPDTSFTAGPGALTNDATPTFEFEADELGVTFECSVDGGAWADCASPWTSAALSEGLHELAVRGTDAVGNVEAEPAMREFEVDLTAPVTQITSGPVEGSRVSSPEATLTFGSPDADASAFRCRLDGGPWTPCESSSSQSYDGLADGDHEFSVRAIDEAGNVDGSPPTRSWTVDATPPQTSIAGGPSGTVRSSNATFRLGSDDSEAAFECSLDGATFEACASPQEYAGLAAGDHVFAARAVDGVGNVDPSPATREWTIDDSAETPPREQEPRRKRRCTFERDLPRCGDAYMRARAVAASAKSGRDAFGKVVLKANGGGSPLGSASFSNPAGLDLRVLEAGKRLGQLELFGFGKRRTIPIDAGGGGVANAPGPPAISIKQGGRKVTIEGLPAKVRRLRLALKSPSLRVESSSCGTKNWKSKLVDKAGNVASASTSADVRCPRGAGR